MSELLNFSKIGEKDWDKNLLILFEQYGMSVAFTNVSEIEISEKEKSLNRKFPEELKELYLKLGAMDLPDNILIIELPGDIHDPHLYCQHDIIVHLDKADSEMAKDLIVFAQDWGGGYFLFNKKNEVIYYNCSIRKFQRKYKSFNDFFLAKIIDLSWGHYCTGDRVESYAKANDLKKKLKLQFFYDES